MTADNKLLHALYRDMRRIRVHGQVEVAAGGQEKSPPPCWGEVSSGAVTSLVFGVAHAV